MSAGESITAETANFDSASVDAKSEHIDPQDPSLDLKTTKSEALQESAPTDSEATKNVPDKTPIDPATLPETLVDEPLPFPESEKKKSDAETPVNEVLKEPVVKESLDHNQQDQSIVDKTEAELAAPEEKLLPEPHTNGQMEAVSSNAPDIVTEKVEDLVPVDEAPSTDTVEAPSTDTQETLTCELEVEKVPAVEKEMEQNLTDAKDITETALTKTAVEQAPETTQPDEIESMEIEKK
uniref:Uncharacterized protein n=1 Tax=Ciona savignyi TaxID=51511 RepID=H2YUQ6_CIOSA